MLQKVHLSASKFDKALDKEASRKYRLSIQLSLDGFSFCILDTDRNKFSGIEAYSFQEVSTSLVISNIITELIQKSDWLKLPFQETRIIFETEKSTLIPAPLFEDEHAADYLRFNHNPDFGDKIIFDRLSNLGAVNVFSIPENILLTLGRFFPGVTVHHFASYLIENLLILNKNSDEGFVIFAYLRSTSIDLLVLDGRNLIFSNSFNYKAKEDCVYFLIYVMEQLNLNPEKTGVTFFGEISKTSPLFDLTRKYVRNVAFGKRTLDYNYSYALDEIPEHYYFNLLNLQRCEL